MLSYPKVFSGKWFLYWQTQLLFIVNFPIKPIRKIIRSSLGIQLDRNVIIARLLHNSYTVRTGENEYIETVYSINYFSKKFKQEWWSLWKLIHRWDINFANKFFPVLNLGFDTLTAYPDAGTENTTVDGAVWRFNLGESFSALRTGAGYDSQATDKSGFCVRLASHDFNNNEWRYIYRGIFTFDTSVLGVGADISSAVFSIMSRTRSDPFSQNLDVVSCNPASNNNIVTADYNYSLFGTTSFASQAIDSMTDYAYTDLTLNASGIAEISKTSITKIGLRLQCDTTGSAPSFQYGKDEWVNIYYADQGVEEYTPKLTITYSGISSQILKIAGIPQASISKIRGIPIVNIKSICGVSNQ